MYQVKILWKNSSVKCCVSALTEEDRKPEEKCKFELIFFFFLLQWEETGTLKYWGLEACRLLGLDSLFSMFRFLSSHVWSVCSRPGEPPFGDERLDILAFI